MKKKMENKDSSRQIKVNPNSSVETTNNKSQWLSDK